MADSVSPLSTGILVAVERHEQLDDLAFTALVHHADGFPERRHTIQASRGVDDGRAAADVLCDAPAADVQYHPGEPLAICLDLDDIGTEGDLALYDLEARLLNGAFHYIDLVASSS